MENDEKIFYFFALHRLSDSFITCGEILYKNGVHINIELLKQNIMSTYFNIEEAKNILDDIPQEMKEQLKTMFNNMSDYEREVLERAIWK